MLTQKITGWYDHVHIELTHRTSELLSCDSVQAAASERVLYFSSCPNCRGSPSVVEHTASQNSSGDSGDTAELAGSRKLMAVWAPCLKKCFKGICFASDYWKSFLCALSTSEKYLVKSLHQHCHLPHLQHKSNDFPVTRSQQSMQHSLKAAVWNPEGTSATHSTLLAGS